MKALLIISAIVEGVAGALLLVVPALPVAMLLGAPLDAPVATVAARLAGAALSSLGIVCWALRDIEGGILGLIAALAFYNAAAIVVLGYCGNSFGLRGPLFWPAVLLHLALELWCLRVLWSDRST